MSFKGQMIKLGFQFDGATLALWQSAARFAIGGGVIAGVKLSIGSSGNEVAMTAAANRALQIYTTQSIGTGTSMTAEIDQTQTGASATIIEVLRVNLDSEVQTGSWANAIVGRINYGDLGDAGGGLAAAVCGEMNLPAKSMTGTGGNYYCFDAEMNVPSGCTLQDSTTRFAAFIKVGAWGSGNFNDYGYFIHVDGLTAATDDLLSLTSHTLKVNLEGNERFLLAGSQIQDGLGLGVTGTPMVLPATASRAVAIFTTSSVAGATVTAFQLKSVTTGAINESVDANFHGYHDTATGGYNCTVGLFYSEWTDAARGPAGQAAAITAKMLIPDTCTGAFFPIFVKLNTGTAPGFIGAGSGGNAAGFMMFSATSGQTVFDVAGLFMEMHNVHAGDDLLLSENSATLRCAIPDANTLKYLVLSNAQDCLSFAARTSEYSAIQVGATGEGNGIQLNASSLPDYAVEIYGDVVTSTLTNVGALNCRVSIAADATVTSNSFTTGIYSRIEIVGAAQLSGWVCPILGYYKTNTTGTVGGSASYNACVVGLFQLKAGYTDPAGTTHAFIAGTYASSPGAITTYSAYYVHPTGSGFGNFDIGFFMGDTGATIGIQLNDCTTGLYLEGDMTDGILISGTISDNAIEITGACDTGSKILITDTAVATGQTSILANILQTANSSNHVGLNIGVTWTPSTPASGTDVGGNAIRGKYTVDGRINATSWMSAVSARLHFESDANYGAGSSIITALQGQVECESDATITAGNIAICQLHNTSALDLTATEGICSYLWFSGVSAANKMKSAMYCSAGSTTYFIEWPVIADTMITETAATGHGTLIYRIACKIGPHDVYLLASTVPA